MCSAARSSRRYRNQSASVQPYSSALALPEPNFRISSAIAVSPPASRAPSPSSSAIPSSLCSPIDDSMGLPKRSFSPTYFNSEPTAPIRGVASSVDGWASERGLGDGTWSAFTRCSMMVSLHCSHLMGRDSTSRALHRVACAQPISLEATQPGQVSSHESGSPGKSSRTKSASLRICSNTAHRAARLVFSPRTSSRSSWSTFALVAPSELGFTLSSRSKCEPLTKRFCMSAPRFQKRWYLPNP